MKVELSPRKTRERAGRVRLRLAALALRVLAEFAWGVVEWLRFLVKRRLVREEVTALLLGRKRKPKSGVLLSLTLALALCGVSSGCADLNSPDREPYLRPETFSLKKAEDTIRDVFGPVHGASNPPWTTLSETILEADPDAGGTILRDVGEFIAP